MWHTFAQVLGAVCALCGAWLAWGPAGIAAVAGLLLAVGSLIVESATHRTNGSD